MSSLKFGQMEFADDDSDVDYKPEDDRLVLDLASLILALLKICPF